MAVKKLKLAGPTFPAVLVSKLQGFEEHWAACDLGELEASCLALLAEVSDNNRISKHSMRHPKGMSYERQSERYIDAMVELSVIFATADRAAAHQWAVEHLPGEYLYLKPLRSGVLL